jgi:hypoxanthine phosphoribosyltransferase
MAQMKSAHELQRTKPIVIQRRSRLPVPVECRQEIECILISRSSLKRRVATLASEIAADYAGKPLLIVALINGSIVFLADLIRDLPMTMRFDLLGVSSYRGGMSSGELAYTKRLTSEVRDHHVLIVDDILDTGKTLKAVRTELEGMKAASVRTCVLLDKPAGRKEPYEADYAGYIIPPWFVVGYGLDYDDRYRNLPFVGLLHPRVYGGEEKES